MEFRHTRRLVVPPAILSLALLLSCFKMSDGGREDHFAQGLTDRDTIAAEMRRVLDRAEDAWYPLSVDTADGGYFSDINYQWQLQGRQTKMIVTQARHVWSAANEAMFSGDKGRFLPIAAHGYRFLRDVMWDREFGGFHDLVDREGNVLSRFGPEVKTAYGNAFAIYGLAAYAEASGDTGALGLAKRTFLWMENHSYDPRFGGYFQFISREGVPFPDGYHGTPPKDQNSMIHILEAFTQLYTVWPDPLVRDRLDRLFHLVRDTAVTNRGHLTLFFGRDWTRVSFKDSGDTQRRRGYELDHVSFGHDVETAYLLMEASRALGITRDSTTLRIGKNMDDEALRYGWDRQNGGIFDGGNYAAGGDSILITQNTKEWWAQVEALNSFLMMSHYFPHDRIDYYGKFCAQWDFCKKYVIDREHGGWYWGGTDIVPNNIYSPKGTIWKADYHTSRGMINCIRRLKQTE